MKNKSIEWVSRMPRHYVGDNCIQIMIPRLLESGMTLLNSDGIMYHYLPDSKLYINKYISDERKLQFPYSNIPTHVSKNNSNKVEYFNQLLEFDRVYLEIGNGCIKENYAIKDGEEALLVTKFCVPVVEESKIMNREELDQLISSSFEGVFNLEGGQYINEIVFDNNYILRLYKQQILERVNIAEYHGLDDDVSKSFFYKAVEKLTIDDIPRGLISYPRKILIFAKNNEIKYVKGIDIVFLSPNEFGIEIYDYPISTYNLEQLKKMEKRFPINTSEPKFPKLLNPNIDKEEVKKEKKRVLSLRRNNK